MADLVVGFDSAWTVARRGGLVAVLFSDAGDGTVVVPPREASFAEAKTEIDKCQRIYAPTTTTVLLDQPTIVKNVDRQRPVEKVVSSLIGRRGGGMQPANTSKTEMFGLEAPLWDFLKGFELIGDPTLGPGGERVVETYPALVLAALEWTEPWVPPRSGQRLPRYNPKKRCDPDHWKALCQRLADAFRLRALPALAEWAEQAKKIEPRKRDQDCLDACLCLLVGIDLVQGRSMLMVGDVSTGYIVAPDCEALREEMQERCRHPKVALGNFVRTFHWRRGTSNALPQ